MGPAETTARRPTTNASRRSDLATAIRFTFERGGGFDARLLGARAPRTIDRMLAALPCETTAYHTRWCGREVYAPVTGSGRCPRENQTATVGIGDVACWCDWDAGENSPETLSVFYGAEIVRDHRGFLTVNIVARVSEEQWPEIERIGLRVWQQGIEGLRIEAVAD